jgi:hypothetical protein
LGGASIAALTLVLAPALAAPQQQRQKAATRKAPVLRAGSFTPAVADPRLAAELARRGFNGNSFRFTPATSSSTDRSRAVRVAVRARAATPAQAVRRMAAAAAAPAATPAAVTAITPTGYNLGVSVGWRRFALSGDVARVKGGIVPGGRAAAEVGVSYEGKKFTGRVDVAADRTDETQARIVAPEAGVSVGVGGSYRIGRNVDVTGGVRYRVERDRLAPLADERRDGQSVYVGTAFRF